MINSILKIAACVAQWLISPERKRAKKHVTKLAIAKEVYSHDHDAVNSRLKKLLTLAVVAGCMTTIGCESVVIVPADREVVPMCREGVSGWFVPDAVMEALIQSAETKSNP